MSALVGYGSSDEEDNAPQQNAQVNSVRISNTLQDDSNVTVKESEQGTSNGTDVPMQDAPVAPKVTANGEVAIEGPAVGPVAGPSIPDMSDETASTPSSPYSAERVLIRNLTLPTVPNLDIPPSPPGSPPPGLETKLENFLKLKKQGIHFNEKLASSSALKNPSLFDKLLKSAGLNEVEQYSCSLTTDIWDPAAFPKWAYKDELIKAQQKAQKQREEELAKGPRDHIDFVSGLGPGSSSRGGTPGAAKGTHGSAAERVMAGLDRDRNSTRQ